MRRSANHRRARRLAVWIRRFAWSGACLVLILGFVSGARAEEAGAITAANLGHYVDSARTAEDHERLAAYYRSQAALKARELKRHDALLKAYEDAPYPDGKNMAAHCRSVIQVFDQAQEAFEGLAEGHEELAREAEK